MKILVTGSTGFIGRRLLEKLIQAGHEVDTLAVDITIPFSMSQNFDTVVHLAAYNITNVGSPDSSKYSSVNVEGTKNVMSGVNARRFVFLSTTKIYGKSIETIKEDSLIDPLQAYEKSKWQAEELCQSLKANKELVILRSTNVFGPGQSEKAVIPVFFARALNNEPIKIFAPKGSWLQFLYVDDLVSALEKVILKPDIEGVFNVASSQGVRIEDLALMIKKICNSSCEITFTDESSEPRFQVSYHKIKEKTGWQPSVSLEEGLRRYYEYVK